MKRSDREKQNGKRRVNTDLYMKKDIAAKESHSHKYKSKENKKK